MQMREYVEERLEHVRREADKARRRADRRAKRREWFEPTYPDATPDEIAIAEGAREYEPPYGGLSACMNCHGPGGAGGWCEWCLKGWDGR